MKFFLLFQADNSITLQCLIRLLNEKDLPYLSESSSQKYMGLISHIIAIHWMRTSFCFLIMASRVVQSIRDLPRSEHDAISQNNTRFIHHRITGMATATDSQNSAGNIRQPDTGLTHDQS
ncbi:hypothetical protein [Vibrio aerogenes]|uniref:hypothetical protein n=1 Tax=Vibrio aerogenes TaxID=92172 RepID=UPI0009360336|nr:hypothetical protein [Vibrio aerogenes]